MSNCGREGASISAREKVDNLSLYKGDEGTDGEGDGMA